MSLFLSSLNVQPNPSLSRSLCPRKNPYTTPKHFKFKQAISKYDITNCLSSRNYQNLVCKYEGLDNTHLNEKISERRTSKNAKSESDTRRFWTFDVVMQRVKNVFSMRKWNAMDIRNLSVMVLMHGLALFAPFYFNWEAFWVFIWLSIVTGMFGICLSFHRNLSHRSFELPKWLEYLCAYCGVLALQDEPITWVRTHRYHHQYCDSERDPHSPLEGFWFSHINWIFDTGATTKKCGEQSNVKDLEMQLFYRLMRSTYYFHNIALAALLYVLGGFPYFVWGMGMRTVWIYHVTFLVNSACHMWGTQAWNTRDKSRNNWWVALVTFGEGWHNNHHAFEYSARHGLEWWQIDTTWYTIKLFQVLGLAKDVKLPIEAHKQRLSFKN